jgi:signal transduction histidine kinase
VTPAPALSGVDGPFSEQETLRLGPLRLWLWRHPVVMDWIVAMAVGIPTALHLALMPDPRLELLPLIIAAAGVLLARRRAPLLVLAVVTAIGMVAAVLTGALSGFDFAIAAAAYAVAANRPTRIAWMSLLAVATAVSAAVILRPGGRSGVAELTGFALVVVTATAIGTSVHNRRAHVAQLVERGNALARETEQRAQLATAAERSRIAREMHDVVAHSLSVMIALADGAAAAIDRSPAAALTAVGQVADTGRAALADMRRVLAVLSDGDATFSPPPGGMDLDHLVQTYRATGMPVTLTVSGAPLPADVGLQLAVYRIVQESLTNALRHATDTGPTTVVVARVPGAVRITVSSPIALPALPPSRTGGRGIIGMRERAAIYGGSVDTGAHGPFWRVRVDLHWDEVNP